MTDERSYRYVGPENHREAFENQSAGLLVPDTRLDTLIDSHTELSMHLLGIEDAWKAYKQAKLNGEDGASAFVVLALRLDRAFSEEDTT